MAALSSWSFAGMCRFRDPNGETYLCGSALLRYFAGLDTEEIAKCVGVTARTVLQDLRKVRLLLIDAVVDAYAKIKEKRQRVHLAR